MTISPIFPSSIPPLSNISPFSYRDGATYLEILYALRDYINVTLRPEFDTEMARILDDFNTALATEDGKIDANEAAHAAAQQAFEVAETAARTAYENTATGLYETFTAQIQADVDTINNKSGQIDIQRHTLTDNTYTVSVDPGWPTNQPVSFVLTQDGTGNRTVTLGAAITGPLILDPAPGAKTKFTLIPDGTGNWNVVTTDTLTETLLESYTATRTRLETLFAPRTIMDEWSMPLHADGAGPGGVTIGEGAAAGIAKNVDAPASTGYIAIGRDALGGTATRGRGCIAIGAGSLGLGANPGVENLGIGIFSLAHVQGVSEYYGDMAGTRNIGIGSLAGHFLRDGYQNTLIGRDSGHSITSGTRNVGVGYRALGCGVAPIGLSGAIENQYISTGSNTTAVGTGALTNSTGSGNVGIGADAGSNLKAGDNNVFVGYRAGIAIGTGISENNKAVTTANKAGTYTQAGGFITVNVTAHGAISGNKVYVQFTDGPLFAITTEAQYLTVAAVPSPDQFTLTGPAGGTGGGSVTLLTVETAVVSTPGNSLVAVGWGALGTSNSNVGNTTAVGEQAGPSSTGGQNTFLGSRSGYNMVDGTVNTFVGYNAGRALTQGGALTGLNQVTCLGAGSTASASNQVQLGISTDTVYAYGAVQNRSDARDKTAVRDTVLGLDFIEQVRPVDFKWNYREDYRETLDDGTVVEHPNDGSKTRARFHHGVIAQEIQKTITDSGVDFGGFQDHAKTGEGADILSIGYEEFIAPLIKAVQELSARVKELENK